MAENPIGSQVVAQGFPFTPMTPQMFVPPFPGDDDPRKPNIIFNTDSDGKWKIFDSNPQYDGETLNEYTNFNYGQSLKVQATWWKKVETVIWCFANTATAQNDLKPYVHVLNGHEAGPVPYDTYSFFPDNSDVTFNVSGTNNRVILVGNDRYYRFIGWSEVEPRIFTTVLNPFQWCDLNLTHIHENVTFDNSLCLKQEYAAFLYGTEVEIIVMTNDPGDMGLGWNNSDKIQYKLIWSDGTYHTQPFNSYPNIDPNNPSYGDPDTTPHIGDYFTLQTYPAGGGSLHYLNGIYELKGWLIGVFTGFDAQQFANIEQSDHFFAGDISQLIYAINTPIVVTAIYMPSDAQYTITYYSGLPELT